MRSIRATVAASPSRKHALKCQRAQSCPQPGRVQSIQPKRIAEADALGDLQGFVFPYTVKTLLHASLIALIIAALLAHAHNKQTSPSRQGEPR